MDIWLLLLDIILLLLGALLFGGLFSRFGQSPLVGYLLAGMILGGPGSINAVQLEKEIEVIAELGVSLFLFSIGLEFSLERLRQLGSRSLLSGALQVVLTAVVCALGTMAVGLSLRESLAVGAILSLSSTAIVLRVLSDKSEVETPHGSNSVALLLVQDIAVVPLSIFITLLAGGNSTGDLILRIGEVFGLALLLIIGLYIFLNHVAVRALGQLTLERNRELTVLLAVLTGFGATWVAHAVGISPALGAFIAGMFLGSSPYATQIRADISSLRVILLTLFFGAAGMVANPLWIIAHAPTVLLFTFAVIVIKAVVVWIIFQAMRSAPHIAATTGLCTAQIGEFAFVLSGIAQGQNVISAETEMMLVSITIISLFISPSLVAHAQTLGMKLAFMLFPKTGLSADYEGNGDANHRDEKIVIIGFGPVGQAAASVFRSSPLKLLVIDLNYELIRKARTLGFKGYVGDGSLAEVLEHAHIESARAVIITVPHYRTACLIVSHLKRLAPQAHVVARSRFERFNAEITSCGADAVFNDEEEVGRQLGSHLKLWLSDHDEIENAALNSEELRIQESR